MGLLIKCTIVAKSVVVGVGGGGYKKGADGDSKNLNIFFFK